MIPAAQYTLNETIGVCLAMCHRALDEVRALALIPGPPGPQGKSGAPGEKGAKGDPGRNAADLVALQTYIEERVDRAFKSATVTTLDGGRTLRWAIGDTVHEIKTAIVLDAGGWKNGKTYVPGDGVSLAGSFYIAQVETTSKPPSDDWRLAVRSGRDGHDAQVERESKPVRFR